MHKQIMFNIVEVAEMMKGLKKANDENRDLEAKLRKTEEDLNELKVEHEVAQEVPRRPRNVLRARAHEARNPAGREELTGLDHGIHWYRAVPKTNRL